MLKTMTSRITGQLKTYVLTEQLITCDRYEADMDALKTNIQREFDTQQIDAQVEGCKQVRATNYDYLICNTWIAIESPASLVIIPAIAILLWQAIIVVLAVAAISIILLLAAGGFKEMIAPTPKYYCSICGAGPFSTIAELTAHRTQTHPEAAQFQCPYCGSAFATAEQLNKHVAECPWRPQGIPDWVMWVVGGGVALGAIYVIIKYLPRKKQG
jgi:DNA-directed RNA polymerase subunit RPC12/RpoP